MRVFKVTDIQTHENERERKRKRDKEGSMQLQPDKQNFIEQIFVLKQKKTEKNKNKQNQGSHKPKMYQIDGNF